MSTATLTASSALYLLTGGIYTYVGWVVSRRRAEGDAKLANNMFVLWWVTIGAISLYSAVVATAAAAGFTDLALYVTLLNLVLLVLSVSLWALAFYLLYLFTGSKQLFVPLGIFYGAYYAFLVYLVQAAHPIAVEVGRWNASLKYEAETIGGPATRALLLLLLLPQVVGAIAYFTLYFKVKDPAQRFRIATISWTIIFWFGSSIVASLANINQTEAWQITSRFIGLAAALVILTAFNPPTWIRRRYEPVRAKTGA